VGSLSRGEGALLTLARAHYPPFGVRLRPGKVREPALAFAKRFHGYAKPVGGKGTGDGTARTVPAEAAAPGGGLSKGGEVPEIILDEEEVDVLREIANIGSGHAAASMEKWLGRDMVLEVPQAFLVPVEEVAEHIGDPLQTIICVYTRVGGEITGHLLYSLTLEDAKALLDILLEPEDRKWGFSPDNLSAIAETANILFSAYLAAVSQISGLELVPGPPACAADMLEAVVNTVLLEICEGSEHTLVLETKFHGEGLSSVGYVLFLAENEALKRLVQKVEEG